MFRRHWYFIGTAFCCALWLFNLFFFALPPVINTPATSTEFLEKPIEILDKTFVHNANALKPGQDDVKRRVSLHSTTTPHPTITPHSITTPHTTTTPHPTTTPHSTTTPHPTTTPHSTPLRHLYPQTHRSAAPVPNKTCTVTRMESVDQLREGPGQMGKPVKLLHVENIEADLQYIKSNRPRPIQRVNVAAHNEVSVHRSLPDYRPVPCKQLKYDFPSSWTVSVLITFSNEPWITLMRTLHSIVNRTPPSLLHEIVLYDDASTADDLQSPLLEDYIKENFCNLVRLHRGQTRLGLIRARMRLAQLAEGSVLVFLDSHSETAAGWLEPLLGRIAEKDGQMLALPAVDSINAQTAGFGKGSSETRWFGFSWSLVHRWEPYPADVVAILPDNFAPLPQPIAVGCSFAVKRDYFFELGGFDEGMTSVWGGENIEMSVRTWMCGGSVELIPCSRVGHMYKKGSQYDDGDTLEIHRNFVRFAEVWMDDYKRFYYMFRPEARPLIDKVGDLSDRKQLREKLQCRDFGWYLRNVYYTKLIPDEDVIAHGYLKHLATDTCLEFSFDSEMRRNCEFCEEPLLMRSCSESRKRDQYWSLDKSHRLRRDQGCFRIHPTGGISYSWGFCFTGARNDRTLSPVFEVSEQRAPWKYRDRCATAERGILEFQQCNGSDNQIWEWEHWVGTEEDSALPDGTQGFINPDLPTNGYWLDILTILNPIGWKQVLSISSQMTHVPFLIISKRNNNIVFT